MSLRALFFPKHASKNTFKNTLNIFSSLQPLKANPSLSGAVPSATRSPTWTATGAAYTLWRSTPAGSAAITGTLTGTQTAASRTRQRPASPSLAWITNVSVFIHVTVKLGRYFSSLYSFQNPNLPSVLLFSFLLFPYFLPRILALQPLLREMSYSCPMVSGRPFRPRTWARTRRPTWWTDPSTLSSTPTWVPRRTNGFRSTLAKL